MKNAKFSPEVHERAVRLVFESRVEGQSLWSTIESVAAHLNHRLDFKPAQLHRVVSTQSHLGHIFYAPHFPIKGVARRRMRSERRLQT